MGTLWQQLRRDWAWYGQAEGGRFGRTPLLQRGFLVVANYRFGHWACGVRTPIAGGCLRGLYSLTNLATEVLTGAVVRAGARIGERLSVHTTQGLLIGGGAHLGDGCTVNTGVCIVERADGRDRGMATIGNEVWIGVGAKILGSVTIGDHCVVGANAVVLRDVPPHSIAIGHPARPLPRRYRRSAEAPPAPEAE